MRSKSRLWLLNAILICGVMICIYTRAPGAQTKELPSKHAKCVMRFERLGGYFGVHDDFFIYPDGIVANASGKIARVSPATVADWLKNISPAAASGEPETLISPVLCSDCFFYRITLYDKEGIPTAFLVDPFRIGPETVYRHFERMRSQILLLFGK